LLLEALKQSGSLLVEETSDNDLFVPTGFTIIDVLGGTIEKDFNDIIYLNYGFPSKLYSACGESGAGKSSLAIQTMAGCVDWWNHRYISEPSDLIIIDAEDNMTYPRALTLTNWKLDYAKTHLELLKSVDVTDIYNLILKIADMKKKNKDKYYVETTMRDIDGSNVKTWATTYILIDSVAALKSKVGLEGLERNKEGELKDVENIAETIDNLRQAKANIDFVSKVKPLAREFGIHVHLINHIIKEMKISMFDIPKKVLPFMKPGERLLGGREIIYQSFSISNLEPKDKLDEKNPIYGDEIYGIMSSFSFVKNKGNVEGLKFPMVFDARSGYKPELSDFEYLFKDSYGIEGSPARLYLSILPELTFTRKTLYNKCKDNPLLSRAIKFTSKLKMIYDLILSITAPDVKQLSSLSFDIRVAAILSFTDPYPGYWDIPINIDILSNYQKGLPQLTNTKEDLSSSFLTTFQINELASLPENELDVKFPLFIGKLRTIYDNKEDFIVLEKDDTPEFWIPKIL
jgi:hypothetical protein